jgi:MoaA/NifB/PqqE/SkfB family radical SAM enzyme
LSEDYVFRYRIEKDDKVAQRDRVLELLRSSLENLLNVVVLTQGGCEVGVDGFRVLMDRNTTYEIFPSGEFPGPTIAPATNGFQDSNSARLYEPRIDFIKRQLEAILSVVELEVQGQPVEIEGFRLRSLHDWLVPSKCDPIEVFGHLATRCNCDCVFCYLKGNPSSVALSHAIRSTEDEYNEVRTRIKYFSPDAERCLFPCLGGIYEPFSHPRALEVLRELRKKTSQTFRIATNGESLTPDLVAQLGDLRPIYLYLSLNSCSPERRARLMGTKRPQGAIDSMPLLRERGIPYAVVVVPWPVDSVDEMLEDLRATVAYADENEAHLAQVNLPGYSGYFSDEPLFDLDKVWSAIVREIRALREEVTCPIVAMPSMYEENLYEEVKNLPRVIGIVRNSPAALCGLKRGDILRQANGLALRNRPQARDVLALVHQTVEREAQLVVERNHESLELVMDSRGFSYPYTPETSNHLGIVFLGTGLRISSIERLRETIGSRRAKHVLLLTSTLVRPTLEQCLSESHLLGDPQLRVDIEVPANRFFGGNVFMGDLLVVQDFIDHIREYVQRTGEIPDLVVIPSSPFGLGQWWRDLTGRVYLDIQREVGIPVELLECDTIYE